METKQLIAYTMELPGHKKCVPQWAYFIWRPEDNDDKITGPSWLSDSEWIRESVNYPFYNEARGRWINTEEEVLEVFHYDDVQVSMDEAFYIHETGDLEFLREDGRFDNFFVCFQDPDSYGRHAVLIKHGEEGVVDFIKDGWQVQRGAVPAVVPGPNGDYKGRLYLKTMDEFLSHFFPSDKWTRLGC